MQYDDADKFDIDNDDDTRKIEFKEKLGDWFYLQNVGGIGNNLKERKKSVAESFDEVLKNLITVDTKNLTVLEALQLKNFVRIYNKNRSGPETYLDKRISRMGKKIEYMEISEKILKLTNELYMAKMVLTGGGNELREELKKNKDMEKILPEINMGLNHKYSFYKKDQLTMLEKRLDSNKKRVVIGLKSVEEGLSKSKGIFSKGIREIKQLIHKALAKLGVSKGLVQRAINVKKKVKKAVEKKAEKIQNKM